MAIDSEVFFHITLILRRWYNNEKMEDFDLDEQLYMTNIGPAQSHDDHVPCPKLFPMRENAKIRRNNVFCPEVRRAVQKRRDYGKTFNLAQKAARCAVEVSGESLLRLKRSLHEWFTEEQRLAHTDDDDDKENFDLSQVKNPIEK